MLINSEGANQVGASGRDPAIERWQDYDPSRDNQEYREEQSSS
jgi:hypothetical protein